MRNFILLIVPVFFIGCASISNIKQPELYEKSANKKPSWITKIPVDDKDYFYFRGIRTGTDKLEDGLTDSRMYAVRQIAEFLGQRGITDYEFLRRNEESTIRDRIKIEGVEIIKGAKELDSYFERWIYYEQDKIIHRFDVYILVTYPKEEYKKITELEKRKKEKELNSQKIDKETNPAINSKDVKSNSVVVKNPDAKTFRLTAGVCYTDKVFVYQTGAGYGLGNNWNIDLVFGYGNKVDDTTEEVWGIGQSVYFKGVINKKATKELYDAELVISKSLFGDIYISLGAGVGYTSETITVDITEQLVRIRDKVLLDESKNSYIDTSKKIAEKFIGGINIQGEILGAGFYVGTRDKQFIWSIRGMIMF